jgi:hypothetical protein
MQKSKKIKKRIIFIKGDEKMAFSSLIDDTRRMNAKMIAMGQSVDIQKMPRPKAGTQMAQKQAMYTPSGSDVEKMLYPKNFKARTYEEEEPKRVNVEMVEEIQIQAKEPAKIIGDDDIVFTPKPVQNEEKKEICFSGPSWQRCKHYKQQGGRDFCKEYLSLCGKERCSRVKF